MLKVSELKHSLVPKWLRFEYIIHIKYMLHKYPMGPAAAVASHRGAIQVVFMWHVFYMNCVFIFQSQITENAINPYVFQ